MAKCHLCNDYQRTARQYRIAFDFTLPQLAQSAEHGCHICTLLLDGIRIFEGKVAGLSGTHQIQVLGGSLDGDEFMEMEIYTAGSLALTLEFFVPPGHNSFIQGVKRLPVIPTDTSSATSMRWARQMLEDCLQSHSTCKPKDIPTLPTRILHIQPTAMGSPPKIKLLQPGFQKGSYACLSHCWGKSRALVTEHDTLSLHREHISWEALPKTFQEAILIVISLGLNLLWIDSLCIIQDDIDDWRQESSNMASIYQGALITVAATRSPDDMGGCFSESSPYHLDYQLPKKSANDDKHAELFVREKIKHIGQKGALSPLLTRAWVCQERLLSPRVLHFCERELAWGCSQVSTCQCSVFHPSASLKKDYHEKVDLARSNHLFPGISESSSQRSNETGDEKERPDAPEPHETHADQPRYKVTMSNKDEGIQSNQNRFRSRLVSSFENHFSLPTSNLRPSTTQRLSRLLHGKRPDAQISSRAYGKPFASLAKNERRQSEELFLLWRQIVMEYSGLDLSKERDRLPAIAGVARQFGNTMEGKYIAGLWLDALPADLLWRVDDGIDDMPELKSFSAPSWSWASSPGKVVYYKILTNDPNFEILDATCTPVSKFNDFGEVKGGSLELFVTLSPIVVALDILADKSWRSRRTRVHIDDIPALLIVDGYKNPVTNIRLSTESVWNEKNTQAYTALRESLHFGRADVYGTGTPGSQHFGKRNLENIFCIGTFIAERVFTAGNESAIKRLLVSLAIRRITGNRYERIGLIERILPHKTPKFPWLEAHEVPSDPLSVSLEQSTGPPQQALMSSDPLPPNPIKFDYHQDHATSIPKLLDEGRTERERIILI